MNDVRSTIINAIHALNQAAHHTADRQARVLLYGMKTLLLQECLRRLSPQMLVLHYQLLNHRRVSVVFTLVGPEGPRCWHLPWCELTKSAQGDIIRRIGHPRNHFANSGGEPAAGDSSTWIG